MGPQATRANAGKAASEAGPPSFTESGPSSLAEPRSSSVSERGGGVPVAASEVTKAVLMLRQEAALGVASATGPRAATSAPAAPAWSLAVSDPEPPAPSTGKADKDSPVYFFVVASHNSSAKLRRTLDHILVHVPPCQIVVADNGSSAYGARRPRARGWTGVCADM